MSEEPKVSDLILAHIGTMAPDVAKRYLDRIAQDARSVADEKAAAEQAKRNEFAKLSGAELAERLSRAKPGSEEFRYLKDANKDYLAVASIPRGPDQAKVTVQAAMIGELVAELNGLIKHPSANGGRIREINQALAKLRAKDLD